MDEDRRNTRFFHFLFENGHIFFIEISRVPSPWIAGEELYGLAAPDLGPLDHL